VQHIPLGRSTGFFWESYVKTKIGGWVGPRAVVDVVVKRKINVRDQVFNFMHFF
jgi:hypothetical protein